MRLQTKRLCQIAMICCIIHNQTLRISLQTQVELQILWPDLCNYFDKQAAKMFLKGLFKKMIQGQNNETKCPPVISHPLVQHKSAQAWFNFLNRLSFHGTVENVKQIPDNPHLNFGMFYSEIPAPEGTRSLLFKRNMFCLHKALPNEPLWVKQMTCELDRPQEDVTKIH